MHLVTRWCNWRLGGSPSSEGFGPVQFANFSLSRLIRSNVLSACGAKDEAVCLPMLFRRRAGLLLLLRLRPRELRPPLLGAAWLGDDDELVAALVLRRRKGEFWHRPVALRTCLRRLGSQALEYAH